MVTKTTLDQKTSRTLLDARATGKITTHTIALLRYLTGGCYYKPEGTSAKLPRDFPVSLSTIAGKIGVSTMAAQRNVISAEKQGFITIRREGRKTFYSLHLDQMSNWPKTNTKQAEKEQIKAKRAAAAARQRKYISKVKPNGFVSPAGDVSYEGDLEWSETFRATMQADSTESECGLQLDALHQIYPKSGAYTHTVGGI